MVTFNPNQLVRIAPIAPKEICSQVGPRGGHCKRIAQPQLDFCTTHNAQVQEGKQLFCWRCDGYAKPIDPVTGIAKK
jgi:hypothetical protein